MIFTFPRVRHLAWNLKFFKNNLSIAVSMTDACRKKHIFFLAWTNNAQFLALIRLKWPICHYHATIFLDYEKATQINLLFLSLVLKLQFSTMLNFFPRALDSFKNIWDKVLKNGPSEILSSTNFTWSILE